MPQLASAALLARPHARPNASGSPAPTAGVRTMAGGVSQFGGPFAHRVVSWSADGGAGRPAGPVPPTKGQLADGGGRKGAKERDREVGRRRGRQRLGGGAGSGSGGGSGGSTSGDLADGESGLIKGSMPIVDDGAEGDGEAMSDNSEPYSSFRREFVPDRSDTAEGYLPSGSDGATDEDTPRGGISRGGHSSGAR